MKIVILSDIHGNLPAFNAVLKDVKKQGINKFIIAGDHTGGCPQHNEVLEEKAEQCWFENYMNTYKAFI